MQSFRHFLEGRENPVIFIDLDGTLVHTSFSPQWAELLVPHQFRKKSEHLAALRDVRLEFLSMSLGEQLTIMKKLGGMPVRHHDVDAVTFLRPGARDFLVECMGIARTCILTQGTHGFQERVVEALDIPVKDLFGNRGGDGEIDYGLKVPHSPAGILVEDMPKASDIVKRKLKAIGLPEDTDRVVNVKKWEGFGGEENDFAEPLKKIRSLVKQ